MELKKISLTFNQNAQQNIGAWQLWINWINWFDKWLKLIFSFYLKEKCRGKEDNIKNILKINRLAYKELKAEWSKCTIGNIKVGKNIIELRDKRSTF